MSKTPLSITLATFNLEEFIEESINSIINQTFKDFELICIDDGSSDTTLKILKGFEAKDARIKVISKTVNEGLAVARNESLKLAKGKYITFLDGDDIYEETLFEKAVELAEKEQSDLVIWDYQVFYKPLELKEFAINESKLKHLDVSDKIALLQRPAFTWVKLLKTEKAKELNIHFPEGRTRQDIPVHWHLVTALDKISILPEKLAYYRQQTEATTSQKDRRVFDLAYVMDETKKNLQNHNLYEKYKNEFLRQRLNLLFGMYDSVKEEYKKEALSLIYDRLEEDEWAYILSNNSLRQQARWFYKKMNGDTVALLRYTLWEISRATFRLIIRNR